MGMGAGQQGKVTTVCIHFVLDECPLSPGQVGSIDFFTVLADMSELRLELVRSLSEYAGSVSLREAMRTALKNCS